MIFLRIFLAIIACYRLAELLKYDEGPYDIITNFRGFIGIRAASGSKFYTEVTKAIHCLHCSGLWFALPLTVLALFPTLLGDVFLVLVGIAGGQSLLITYLGTEREDS